MATKSKLVLTTCCLVLLGFVSVALWPRLATTSAEIPVTMPAPHAAAIAERTGETPDRSQLQTPPEEVACIVAGRVVDEAGHAVPDAALRFWIGPGEWDRTEMLRSDQQGEFRLTLPEPQEVMVTCSDQRWRLLGTRPRVQAPAEDVTLVVQRLPTGKVIIRVRDLATGELVQRFDVRLNIPGIGFAWPGEGSGGWSGSMFGAFTVDGVIEQFVRVHDGPEPTGVQIDLREPGRARHRLYLREGDVAVLEIGWESGLEIRGIVTDTSGKAIAGAVVYGGGQIVARGDEPFKVFKATRVPNGVRTGADGTFAIRAAGATHLTVWHPEHTSVTLPAANAYHVQLQPRGGIRGKLVDGAGRARAGVSILIDQDGVAITDAEGRFSFENIEAGLRGLHIPGPRGNSLNSAVGGPWSVQVEPGVFTEVVLDPGISEALLLVRAGGRPYGEPLVGGLVGLDSFASPRFGEVVDGQLAITDVIPGDYLFISDQGHLAGCTIQGQTSEVELGVADLTVQAKAGTRVYLVPQSTNELARIMVRRMAQRPVPESGILTFEPLPVGMYKIYRDGGETGELIYVGGPGTKVVLD